MQQGRQYDHKGNLSDWWQPEDAEEYERRVAGTTASSTAGRATPQPGKGTSASAERAAPKAREHADEGADKDAEWAAAARKAGEHADAGAGKDARGEWTAAGWLTSELTVHPQICKMISALSTHILEGINGRERQG